MTIKYFQRIAFEAEGVGTGTTVVQPGGVVIPPAGQTNPAQPAAPAPAPAAPWYEKAPAELNVAGYLENRGWAGKPVDQVAIDAIKAHQEAQKFLGTSPDRLLRIPDQNDGVATAAFWERLGAPKNADGYDLSTVKTAAGQPVDADLADTFRTTAAKLHLPKDAAVEMVKAAVSVLDARAQKTVAETTAAIETGREALKKDWGSNFEANKFVAQQAAKALGVDVTVIATLEKSIGYTDVMRMFHRIGQKMGEDQFISGQGSNPGVMSVSQAKDQLKSLKGDKEWVKRYMAGDQATRKQADGLHQIIASGMI